MSFEPPQTLNLVEASIADLQAALSSGALTSVELVARYLRRISAYDCRGPSLNAIPVLNEKAFDEAGASDDRRRQKALCLAPRYPETAESILPSLEGIPFTVKDSYRVRGMTVAAGSPAFSSLISPREDAFTVAALRGGGPDAGTSSGAGAVLLGRTNMPSMAYGGMQRGIYGRAESPYALHGEWLAAAFASGSSNGSGVSTAASMAAFGLGEETVSSGRSPASNNGLVAYTPSRGGWVSLRGNWPLYLTRDVVVPHTRSVADLLAVLRVIGVSDPQTAGDFWRDQPFVALPQPWPNGLEPTLEAVAAVCRANETDSPLVLARAPASMPLAGLRIAVPGMYIGGPAPAFARPVATDSDVVTLWTQARRDLEALGAEIVVTDDFPAVTAYENPDEHPLLSVATDARLPACWRHLETGPLIALGWNDFLRQNGDPAVPDLLAVDPMSIYPDTLRTAPELRNVDPTSAIQWPLLHDFVRKMPRRYHDVAGLPDLLRATERMRRVLLEDWLDGLGCDVVAFPAAGDVGAATADIDQAAFDHAAKTNGVFYSTGNRAIRHLGIPTVTVPMGLMAAKQMCVGLTFAGRAYDDARLLRVAAAYEAISHRRTPPPRTPSLPSDFINLVSAVPLAQRAPRPRLHKVEAMATAGGVSYDHDPDNSDSVPVTVTISGIIVPDLGQEEIAEPVLEVVVDAVDVPTSAITLDRAEDTNNGSPAWIFSARVATVRPKRPDVRERTLCPVARDKIMVVVLAKMGPSGCPSGWLGML